MSVSYGGDSITFADGSVNSSGFIGHRNRIINGAMVIDQRNAGASVTIDNGAVFTLDRWQVEDGSDAVLSAQQSTDVPTGQGFVNSLKVTATTADSSIGATQYDVINYYIEGYNIADLMFGSASAQTVTLSFWIKSAVAGQYSATLSNSGQSRINPQAFTINAANTWEKKTITYIGDTSGTWLTNNGRGIIVQIYLSQGSTYLGSAGWNGSNIFAVTGQVNFVGTLNNAIYLTGVQLERGSTASSFEYRPYGTELALCQRYYENNYSTGYAVGSAANYPYNNGQFVNGYTSSSGQKFQTANFLVQKRTAQPTNTYYDAAGNSGKISTLDAGGTDTNNVSPGVTWLSDKYLGAGPSTGTMTGSRYFWTCSAEL